MLLAIDVGNTETVIGLYALDDAEQAAPRSRCRRPSGIGSTGEARRGADPPLAPVDRARPGRPTSTPCC